MHLGYCIILYTYVTYYMPLNGGIKQQLKRDRESAESVEAGDHQDDGIDEVTQAKLKTHRAGGRSTNRKSIGQYLKEMYLIGRLSAPEFQEASAASVHSSASDSLCSKISTTGKSGDHRYNCHRDIMKHLDKLTDRLTDSPQIFASGMRGLRANRGNHATFSFHTIFMITKLVNMASNAFRPFEIILFCLTPRGGLLLRIC